MYEEVKRDIRLGDVLTRYGIYHPDRISYRIPCPLHHGRDANFSVSEDSGLWNCFSVCGRGGSVIDLVAALEGIEPKEAVKKLATEFHVTPAAMDAQAAREYKAKSERFNVWRDTKREDHDIELPLWLTPLEEGYRGFRQGTINHWGLFRLKNTWRGESNPLLPPEGVFVPLHNTRGGYCSYSIRTDSGEPKFWNAPGISKCYPFGLYLNKTDIIREGFAWVVEGQFDAISLWQKGYRNVIALMGSSMTEQQAMMILAVTSSLVLVMDGDNAGREAAVKIKDKWSSVFDISIFHLPEGVDPDEYEGVLVNDMATLRVRTDNI